MTGEGGETPGSGGHFDFVQPQYPLLALPERSQNRPKNVDKLRFSGSDRGVTLLPAEVSRK